MTQEEEDRIRALVTDAVCAALEKSPCSCSLSPGAQKELPHFMGMLRDVSPDGRHASGIEIFRVIAMRNHRYVRWSRRIEGTLLATVTGWALIRLIVWIADQIVKYKGGS